MHAKKLVAQKQFSEALEILSTRGASSSAENLEMYKTLGTAILSASAIVADQSAPSGGGGKKQKAGASGSASASSSGAAGGPSAGTTAGASTADSKDASSDTHMMLRELLFKVCLFELIFCFPVRPVRAERATCHSVCLSLSFFVCVDYQWGRSQRCSRADHTWSLNCYYWFLISVQCVLLPRNLDSRIWQPRLQSLSYDTSSSFLPRKCVLWLSSVLCDFVCLLSVFSISFLLCLLVFFLLSL